MNNEKQLLLEDLAYYVKIVQLQEEAIQSIVDKLQYLKVSDKELIDNGSFQLFYQFYEIKQ